MRIVKIFWKEGAPQERQAELENALEAAGMIKNGSGRECMARGNGKDQTE